MELSIIILNYKSRGLLKQCLKAVRLLSLPFTSEVIVVDNNSHDGTGTMMREEFPDYTFIQSERNDGYAAGNNQGIRRSTGKYVLVMNPDVAALGDAIQKMHAYLESHPDVGVVGPKLLNPDGSVQASCRTFPSIRTILYRRTPLGRFPNARRMLRSFLMLGWDHNDDRTVDWLLGACLMIRRTAMDRVGLLDERFFLYFEDVDWCRRFWQEGFPVAYLGKSAEMVHYHKRLSAEHPGLTGVFGYATRIHISSGIKYFLKYAGAKLPARPHGRS